MSLTSSLPNELATAVEHDELAAVVAADERRFMWRAVASATAKLGKARLEVVQPIPFAVKWPRW